MATHVEEVPQPTGASRPKRRLRFPLLVIVGAAVLLAVVWSLPEHLTVRGLAVSATMMVVIPVSLLSLAAWFVFFSGLRAPARLLGLVLLVVAVGGAAASIRNVEFSGEMVPTFVFRWQPQRAVVLEAQREGAGRAESLPVRALEIGPLDVAEYRGPLRDGVVEGPALARDWSSGPREALWRQPVGGGYAAFVIVGQTAFTIEQRRDNEALVAYETASGKERWVHEYPALFHETASGDGPRATPTVAGGKLYSLGATGELVCLNATDGEKLWEFNLLTENQSSNTEWGMSGSPLIVDDLCIVNPGADEDSPESRAVWAVDAATGEVRWKSGRTAASYASPMLVELAGELQILIFDAAGLFAFGVENGDPLWAFEWETLYDINAAQPLVLPGDRVLITSDAGAAVVEVSWQAPTASSQQDNADEDEARAAVDTVGGWLAREVWINKRLKGSFASPVYREGHVYGIDRGVLACIEAETGRRVWKQGRFGHGQLLLSGDLLVILSEKGELALVEATPEEYRELARMPAIDGKTWNNPTLVDGRAYVRNHIEMACYDLR